MVNGLAVKTMAFFPHPWDLFHELLQASWTWFQFYRAEEMACPNSTHFQNHMRCLQVVKGIETMLCILFIQVIPFSSAPAPCTHRSPTPYYFALTWAEVFGLVSFFTESLKLENTSKIIMSKHQTTTTTMPTKPSPQVQCLHIFFNTSLNSILELLVACGYLLRVPW